MPDLLRKNPSFKLAIVGEGEEKENLKFKIKELKLEENVKLTGKVEHKNIPFYFRKDNIVSFYTVLLRHCPYYTIFLDLLREINSYMIPI